MKTMKVSFNVNNEDVTLTKPYETLLETPRTVPDRREGCLWSGLMRRLHGDRERDTAEVVPCPDA